jgi:TRAP transporter TAXI family solute receptor
MIRLMNKSWVSILAGFCLLLAGCAGGDSGDGGGGPQFLSMGTAPAGGAFFPVGGALGETLNEHRGDNRWQVTAEATKGSQENIRRLQRGELDLALANAAIAYFAARGESGWDQAYDVKAVMTLAPNVALFITPESSGITELSQLAGKRVVVGPAGAGFEFFVKPLLEAHGLTYDDFTPLNATQTGAVDMLADGSAAAAFLGGAMPTASITQATSAQPIRFLSYGEQMDDLTERYSFFQRLSIPAGTYRGLDEDFPTLNVGSMLLITSGSADEELVYQLTKTLYDNRATVVEKHGVGKAINPNNVVRDTGLEFHPGAVRFYREAGIWPEDSAE